MLIDEFVEKAKKKEFVESNILGEIQHRLGTVYGFISYKEISEMPMYELLSLLLNIKEDNKRQEKEMKQWRKQR